MINNWFRPRRVDERFRIVVDASQMRNTKPFEFSKQKRGFVESDVTVCEVTIVFVSKKYTV